MKRVLSVCWAYVRLSLIIVVRIRDNLTGHRCQSRSDVWNQTDRYRSMLSGGQTLDGFCVGLHVLIGCMGSFNLWRVSDCTRKRICYAHMLWSRLQVVVRRSHERSLVMARMGRRRIDEVQRRISLIRSLTSLASFRLRLVFLLRLWLLRRFCKCGLDLLVTRMLLVLSQSYVSHIKPDVLSTADLLLQALLACAVFPCRVSYQIFGCTGDGSTSNCQRK